MQACEPYDLHNTKISEVKERVYEECKASSDADKFMMKLYYHSNKCTGNFTLNCYACNYMLHD